MDDDATNSQPDVQMEDASHPEKASASTPKASSKSWKKKYRKMRQVFEHKMREGEERHRMEVKAIATNKRLAIEVDRMLDLLLDINNSIQIPPERRFDLSLPDDMPGRPDFEPVLDIDLPDHKHKAGYVNPSRSLRHMLRDVPHTTYAQAAKEGEYLQVVGDLEAGLEGPAVDPAVAGQPANFLTADDIDNYIWEVDQRVAKKRRDRGLDPPEQLPTLAPKAQEALHEELLGRSGGGGGYGSGDKGDKDSVARDFALRNPTSVYNWLRKHEPKIFLQDGESAADKENGDDSHHHGEGKPSSGRGGGRKSTGASDRRASGAPSRANAASAAKSSSRAAPSSARGSKRASMSARSAVDPDETMSHHPADDQEADPATPSAAAVKGKRKRTIDDDAGYRPKGGSSRPTKKKRQSQSGPGAGESTPATAPRKARKSASSAIEVNTEAFDGDD